MGRNLIFVCVFHNEEYIALLELLLQSIHLYGEIDNVMTDILIYTTSSFLYRIQAIKVPLINTRIVVQDAYQSVTESCRARLDLFQILDKTPYIHYDTVLYLDTDILVVGPLTPIFQLVDQNEAESTFLYALEEGTMQTHDPYWDYYGKTLFPESEWPALEDQTAFSSGILLFRPSSTMRVLFETISKDIVQRPICKFDQPYIVHHAIRTKQMNNQALKPYAILFQDLQTNTNTQNLSLIHFAGGVGVTGHKRQNMQGFLDRITPK